MKEIKRMGKLGRLVCFFWVTCFSLVGGFLVDGFLVDVSAAQIRPVSAFHSVSSATAPSLPFSNPVEFLHSTGGFRAITFVEVPFGLPELAASWLSLRRTGKSMGLGLEVSDHGFEEFRETSLLVGFARVVRRQTEVGAVDGAFAGASSGGAVGMSVGVMRTKLGLLGSVVAPFWKVGARMTAPGLTTGFQTVLRLELDKEAVPNSGMFSPTAFRLDARTPISRFSALSGGFSSSTLHGSGWVTGVSFSLRERVELSVGYESSRSIFFGTIHVVASPFFSSVHVSHHPVLGASTGLSLSYSR